MAQALNRPGKPVQMPLTSQIAAEPAAIERALQDLWRGEAAQAEGSPVICARTVNLVVCCAAGDEPLALHRELEPVTASHPGRVIVIAGSRDTALQARVSASCMTSHQGGRYLGRELIELRGDDVPSQQLTSIVNSLLLPDLPVFLWWRDAGATGSELFAALVPRARRVIVDSAAASDTPAALRALLEQVHRHRHAAFTDLAWTRVTPWRQLAAQFFDNPAFCGYAARLQRMTVEYAVRRTGAASVRPEPVFLSAWLALSLGHSPASAQPGAGEGNRRLRFSGGKVPLDVELRQVNGNEEWIQQVVLEAPQRAEFRMARTADGRAFSTTTTVAGQPPVQRTARAAERTTADCLARELDFEQRDELYERVLETACRIGETPPR